MGTMPLLDKEEGFVTLMLHIFMDGLLHQTP